jgi:4-amino-4-deoxy-L-arabinose transferase-like glycosyltransferase
MAWWLLAGVATGVGLLSKYTMVLFFAGLGVIWLVSPGNRKRIFQGSMMTGIVALIFFCPVIWWNSRHAWASFAHQLNHGFRNEHHHLVNFQNLADYVVFLVVLTSPVVGLLCFRTAFTRMVDERYRFLGAFFWPVVAFFGFSAAKAHVEANWPMVAFVGALIMVAGDWEHYGRGWRKVALIVLLIADLGFAIGITLIPLFQNNSHPLLSQVLKIQKACEFLGNKTITEKVKAEFKKSGSDFVCVSSYQLFGVLAFYAPEIEPILWLPFQGPQRLPWIDDKKWAGKDALNVSSPRREPPYRWLFRELSSELNPDLAKGEEINRPIYFWIGKGYEPSQLYGR